MALTKEIVIDKIEILENGTMQVRTVTRVLDDGDKIGERYHRVTYPPTTALATLPTQRLRAHANIEWTPAVIAAYEAAQAAALATLTRSLVAPAPVARTVRAKSTQSRRR